MLASRTVHGANDGRGSRGLGWAAALLAVWAWTAAMVPGQARAATEEPIGFVEITPQVREAVDKGLAYLAQAQTPAGSFGPDRSGSTMGISSLALLAFLADGNTPTRGRYAPTVARGLEYVLRHSQESGLIASDFAGGPMYGHGYATLFLGEVYGMTGDPRVREVLRKAVRLIVISQNPQGGWRYNPVPIDADISVTICQIMALRSARNAGLSVPKETIDRAILYVRNCQNESDGGFRYMIHQGPSGFPRSAAGVASLYYAGIYQDDALKKGLDYLLQFRTQVGSQNEGHYFYGHYYAVQAMYLAGGRYWAEWFPAIREEMLRRQQSDGAWPSEHGNEYGAANALLILQQPSRLLPIYQR